MSSIVLDLQQEIIMPNSDVVDILRKAHIIATKLNLKEFDRWITNELNGYSDSDEIPDYRTIQGILKAYNPRRGWVSVMIPNPTVEKAIIERKLYDSITALKELCSGKTNPVFNFPGDIIQRLNQWSTAPIQTQFKLEISPHHIKNVIEQVKNCILDWTMKLESEGIVGENLRFNDDEKTTAQGIPQSIYNYYGNTNVINAPLEKSTIVVGDESNISFSYSDATDAMHEIKESINHSGLSSEDQAEAFELLSEITEKIEAQKKPGVIKAAMTVLKDFLIGAGASATVALIQAKMQGLF